MPTGEKVGIATHNNVTWYGGRPRSRGNWTTRGFANSLIANSRTGHLTDWSTHGLDNSRTSQLADWTSCGLDNSRSRRCRQKGKLSTQSRRRHPRVVQSASCLVRELTSLRVVQSASWCIRELSSNRSRPHCAKLNGTQRRSRIDNQKKTAISPPHVPTIW